MGPRGLGSDPGAPVRLADPVGGAGAGRGTGVPGRCPRGLHRPGGGHGRQPAAGAGRPRAGGVRPDHARLCLHLRPRRLRGRPRGTFADTARTRTRCRPATRTPASSPTPRRRWRRPKRLGLADTGRVAILGHSMGSGVALSFGQRYPATAATIAVSPVGTAVTPSLPRNLLLMAGSLEPGFVANAEKRLAEAGGAGGDPSQGTGRRLQIIPNVEHISILFSPLAHATALQWLDATFGPQPGAAPYTDARVAWFGLGALGTLLAAATLVPRAAAPRRGAAHVDDDHASPLVASPVAGRGRRGGDPGTLGGGAGRREPQRPAGPARRRLPAALVRGGRHRGGSSAGHRPSTPSPRDLLAGLLIFAALWLGIGLLGDAVWLPWVLIPKRLALWPLGIRGAAAVVLGRGRDEQGQRTGADGLVALPERPALRRPHRGHPSVARPGLSLAHPAALPRHPAAARRAERRPSGAPGPSRSAGRSS